MCGAIPQGATTEGVTLWHFSYLLQRIHMTTNQVRVTQGKAQAAAEAIPPCAPVQFW